MIGSEEFAEKISSLATFHYEPPKGWKYLSNGTDRRVFQGPDGLVYKLDMYRGRRTGNALEAATLTECKSRGYVWVPEFTLFENKVLVMEFLKTIYGEEESTWTFNPKYKLTGENLNRWKEIRKLIEDSHSGNLGYDERGDLKLRDGGHGFRPRPWTDEEL